MPTKGCCAFSLFCCKFVRMTPFAPALIVKCCTADPGMLSVDEDRLVFCTSFPLIFRLICFKESEKVP